VDIARAVMYPARKATNMKAGLQAKRRPAGRRFAV